MSEIATASLSASNEVFSEESLQILRVRGNDTRVISRYRNISNTSYTSVSSVGYEATTVSIPEKLESIETIQFLEFTPDAASIVWRLFEERQRDEPHRATIIGAAQKHISAFETIMYPHDDWVGTMEAMGLTKDFQNRLMDPDFDDMRLASTLKDSIFEMFQMRYDFLCSLEDLIKGPAINSIGRRSCRLNSDGQFITIEPDPFTEE